MSEQNKLLLKLSCEEKIEILRKNWMSHDARWQMAIVKNFGWKKGNKINKAVIFDMGKIMMRRLMNALDIKKINTIQDHLAICNKAMELYYPYPLMEYNLKIKSENELTGIIKKCITQEQVKNMNVDKFYECGCFSMRSGWFKALGLKVEEECLKCLKNGDDECVINSKIINWNE